MTQRRRIMASVDGGTDPSQAEPLEVAFYNSALDRIVIRKQKDWIDGETPIGIVVVPGYHDRYGDGSCGIMSLVGMDYNNPESGEPITGTSQTDSIKMYWGHYIGGSVGNNIFVGTTALVSSEDYIPYQESSTSTACTIYSYHSYDGDIIWPYAGTTTAPTNGASTAYTNTNGYVTATTGKAGCDFNGIRNTAACYVKTRTAGQWTASTVENYVTQTNTPAAACAGRFKTVGTKSFIDVFRGITSNSLKYGTSTSTKTNKGFWYLPAMGELCYLPSKKFEINKTIRALNKKYGNVGIQIGGNYHPSSRYNASAGWVVSMIMGKILGDLNRPEYYVRAFMRL